MVGPRPTFDGRQRAFLRKLGQQRDEKILKLLTDEQMAKWKELTGPPLVERAR